MVRVFGVLAAAFMLSTTASWWDDDVVDTVVWHSFGFVAAVAMWIGVWRRPREERHAWSWIAVGLTAWVFGDVAWDILSWNAPLPDLSLVDAFYLTGYACFFVGVLVLVQAMTGTIPRDAMLDGLILAVASGLVFWVTLVRPAADPGSAAYNGVTLAYPLFAIALMAAIAWLRLHPERRTLPSGTGLLAGAVILLVILEPISAWYWLTEPDVDLVPLMDRFFQVCFGLMVLAVYRTGDQSHRPRRHGLHPLRLVMLAASLAAAPVTMLLVEGSESTAVIAAAVVSTLVLARFTSLSRARERAQQELTHQATHDPLTGLGNRTKLYETMDDFVQSPGDPSDGLTVLYLDLDSFKSINDTHGHAVGDALLVELANRIRQSLRPTDVATRLGGDEFVVLCQESGGLGEAQEVAEHLLERVGEPFRIGSLSLAVTVSIGLASTDRAGADLDQLLRSADAALYKAKRNGRNAAVTFDDAVGVELEDRNRIATALAYSLEHGGLELRLEPVLAHGSGQIIGNVADVDAMLSTGERVRVDLDLLGDDQGALARRLVEWFVDQVADLDEQQSIAQPIFLAIRSTDLCAPGVLETIRRNRGPRSVDPGMLVFELTDDDLRRFMRDAPAHLDALLSTGVRIGVRDFGGVGSSLTAARTLPFSVARIDRRRHDLDDQIAGSLQALASGLGLTTYEQGQSGEAMTGQVLAHT